MDSVERGGSAAVASAGRSEKERHTMERHRHVDSMKRGGNAAIAGAVSSEKERRATERRVLWTAWREGAMQL